MPILRIVNASPLILLTKIGRIDLLNAEGVDVAWGGKFGREGIHSEFPHPRGTSEAVMGLFSFPDGKVFALLRRAQTCRSAHHACSGRVVAYVLVLVTLTAGYTRPDDQVRASIKQRLDSLAASRGRPLDDEEYDKVLGEFGPLAGEDWKAAYSDWAGTQKPVIARADLARIIADKEPPFRIRSTTSCMSPDATHRSKTQSRSWPASPETRDAESGDGSGPSSASTSWRLCVYHGGSTGGGTRRRDRRLLRGGASRSLIGSECRPGMPRSTIANPGTRTCVQAARITGRRP